MHITNTQQGHKGLFAELTGVISAVGLIEPVLSGGLNPSVGYWRFGALVGINKGTINASWVRGGSITTMGEGSIAGGLVGQNGVSPSERGTVRASYSTARVSNSNGEATNAGGLVGSNVRGTIVASYAAGAVQGGGTDAEFGCLAVNTGTGFTPITGTITNSYWDTDVCTRGGGGGRPKRRRHSAPAGYGSATATPPSIYANWNLNVDGDAATGDDQGRDDPWDFRRGHYPVLKYGSAADVAAQRPLLAEAGAAVEAYSGQTVTLDGSGSRAPSGATYRWTRMPADAEPMVTINGATTPAPTFLAPTGLTSDTTMTFRLTLTADGRSVYDEVTVSIVAVRPNQLLSLYADRFRGRCGKPGPAVRQPPLRLQRQRSQPDRQRHGNARRPVRLHDDPQRPGRNQRRRSGSSAEVPRQRNHHRSNPAGAGAVRNYRRRDDRRRNHR